MFQKIKGVVDVVQHISQIVELRRGNPMEACCPFHKERTPSFKVWPDHWYCFGCGEGGSVIDFEMKRQNLSAVEAAKWLCEKYGIVISRDEEERYARAESQRQHKRSILDMLPQMLPKRPDIITWLHEKRGFSDQTIADLSFGVGIKDNCVIVPISDKFGRVVAFASRHLDYEQRGLPKWVNDREDDIYDKKSILYNLDKARRHLGNDDKLVIAESYFDVAALWEAGIRTAVAYCGSKLTKEQAAEIKAVLSSPGSTLVFVACNDKVAQERLGVNRALLRSVAPDVHIRAMRLPPECKDVNDLLLAKGKDEVRLAVAGAVPMDKHLLERSLDEEPTVEVQYRKAKALVLAAENSLSQRDLITYLADRWKKDEATVTQYVMGKDAASGAQVKFRDMTTLVAEYERYVATLDQHRITFGWDEYDRVTRGMRPGDVVQFIARAGTGKTTWCQQLQLNIGRKMPHVPMIFYSLEQKAVMAFERYMQMGGALESGDVEKWMVAGQDERNSRIYRTAQGICKDLGNMLVCDEGGLTLQQVEALTREAGFAYFGKPVGVIFIDYLGYLKWHGSWRSIYEMVSMIAREQKEIAKRLNCVIVSLHQVTKAGSPGEPIEAYHARDSGAVEESADIMIGAWRPELSPKQVDAEKKDLQGVWRTKFLKNRYGPSNVIVDFQFFPQHLLLTPRPKDETTTKVVMEAQQQTLPPAPDRALVGGRA